MNRNRSLALDTVTLVVPLVALLLVSCGRTAPREVATVSGTRGYILISLDALSAYHVGAYGYERDTTPFFDSLAESGTLFEHAVTPFPSTLLAHMSMFTGLYPAQHAVFPPDGVLSEEIPTLAERFRDLGYRTAGHTEAGFMTDKFGIDRGFEEYSEHFYNEERGVTETFDRGVRFLEGLAADEPFFLMLHTYSVHDPYIPPAPYDAMFLEPGQEVPDFPLRGEFFREVNEGKREISDAEVSYLKSLYDAQVRYVDAALESFVADLERLGLRDETTLIITSDHGEEFRQHGKLVHIQVYPEVVFAPLLILHPEVDRAQRVAAPVELIDLAATLWELAGIEHYEPSSATSLVPYLSHPERRLRDEAYAETLFEDRVQKTLIRRVGDDLYQLVVNHTVAEADGVWFGEKAVFETEGDTLEFDGVSFSQNRTVEVRIDDEVDSSRRFELHTDWTQVRLDLGSDCAPCRVTLSTDGCRSPLELGLNEDPRCLGFKLRGFDVARSELFNLTLDPGATHDLALTERDTWRDMLRGLTRYAWQPVAPPGDKPLDPATERVLRSLGYL